MIIKITRPFYLVTLLWKYKVEINGNTCIVKKPGETFIEVADSPILDVTVTAQNNYIISHITIDDANICKGIEIRCRTSNISAILILIGSIAAFIITLCTGNELYLYLGILIYSILGIIYFDLKRKSFFRINCVE